MIARIPKSADDLTAAWFTDIFRARDPAFRTHVAEVHRRCLDSTGANSKGVLCRLTYASPTPLVPDRVFVKLASTNPQNREAARVFNLYGREVWLYQHAAAIQSSALLPCYFASHDAELNEVVIVLADVSFRVQPDAPLQLPHQQMASLLETLATIHAWGWASQELPYPAVCAASTASADAAQASVERFAKAWTYMPERIAGILPPTLLAQAQRFGDALTAERQQHVQDHLNRMPRTLIHGDLHADNLIVPNDEEPWTILDWQTCGWGPAVLDLAYVVAGALKPDDVSHETALLQHYYDRLPATIRADYARTQFLEDYLWALASIFRYAILVGATLDLRNARLHTLYRTVLSGIIVANDRWHTFSSWI